jgi:hypothetical protein
MGWGRRQDSEWLHEQGLHESRCYLYITQLLEEGMVGITWSRIHPHGHLPLMERLNPAAKKGSQEVCARQPPVQ